MKRKLSFLLVLCLLLTAIPSIASADVLYGSIKTPAADGSVNIRSEAGVTKPIIGWAKNGAAVEILYRGNSWHKVMVVSSGKVGWVYGRYVKINSSTASSGGVSSDSSSVSGNVASVMTKYPSSTVNIRAGAGTGYAVLAEVRRGTRMSVLGSSDNWYQVYVPSKGVTGYISKNYTSLGLAAKTTGNVNFRTGAGTGYSRIGTIGKGSSVTVLNRGESWSQVSYGGKMGYISNKYYSFS